MKLKLKVETGKAEAGGDQILLDKKVSLFLKRKELYDMDIP